MCCRIVIACVDVCVVWWWMMNDEWSVIRWIICPPWVRHIGRGKPNISLMFGWKEEMKPEMISSPLLISKSTTTGVALMISESAATQFSSTILMSAANKFSLPNCDVSNESVFIVELWCLFLLSNCSASNESVFAAELWRQQRIGFLFYEDVVLWNHMRIIWKKVIVV